jgi:23S rRNA A1618 N6-methylase RlmF
MKRAHNCRTGSSIDPTHVVEAETSGSSCDENDFSLDVVTTANFEEIGRQFPSFRKELENVQQSQKAASKSNKNQVNRQSKPAAVSTSFASHVTPEFGRELTRALLHIHWQGLAIPYLPDDHLCPPVPNRFFFVCWIQRTLIPRLPWISCEVNDYFLGNSEFANGTTYTRNYEKVITGIDIGTGASAIYALLHVATANQSSLLHSYHMCATDVDPTSVNYARLNVEANAIAVSSRIHVHLVNPTKKQSRPSLQSNFQHKSNPNLLEIPPDSRNQAGPLAISASVLPKYQRIDFAMCNPPFYDDNDCSHPIPQRILPRAGDGKTRTPMTVFEGSYPGGEIGFVTDMFVDSLRMYAEQASVPGWTCVMCGKRTSFTRLRSIITTAIGIGHVAVAEFGPGHMTRWFIAWTFEVPSIRSPLARMDCSNDSRWAFTVNVNATSLPGELEVVGSSELLSIIHRFEVFCSSLFPNDLALRPYNLENQTLAHLTMYDTKPTIQRQLDCCVDEHNLPASVIQVFDEFPSTRVATTPSEGHYVLDIDLSLKLVGNSSIVHAKVSPYAHSMVGRRIVEKIRESLFLEISRTNRRWRRKMKQVIPDLAETFEANSMMDVT